MFRCRPCQLDMLLRIKIIKIDLPPAAGIADVGQIAAIGRKSRLEDGGFGIARQSHNIPRIGQARSIKRQFDQAQLAAIPGHLRMIPGDKGDVPASRMPDRLHDKVGAISQLAREVRALRIDNRQPVYMLIAVHIGDPIAIGGQGRRGAIAEFRG